MAKAKTKVSKKKTTKKAPVKKKAAAKVARKKVSKKKAPAKKTVTKKTTKKKVPARKKATAKKTATKKAPAKKAPAKKASAKKSPTKKAAAKKAPAKKAPAKKTPAKKKAAAAKTTVGKKTRTNAKSAGKVTKATAKQSTAAAEDKTFDDGLAIPSKRAPIRKRVNLDEIEIAADYKPSDNEEYMCPQHLLYFKRKLEKWRDDLIVESQETLEHLRTETRDVGDEAERASRESDNILELRTRDRYRKLLRKIEEALKRVEDGAYGYCEETGEEIGLGRLEARPIATLTVDAQERREMFQKQFRDDR